MGFGEAEHINYQLNSSIWFDESAVSPLLSQFHHPSRLRLYVRNIELLNPSDCTESLSLKFYS